MVDDDDEDEEYVWPESSLVVKDTTFLFFHFCFLITGVNKSSVDRLVCLVKFTEDVFDDEPFITDDEVDDEAKLKFVLKVSAAFVGGVGDFTEFLRCLSSSSSSSSSVPEDGQVSLISLFWAEVSFLFLLLLRSTLLFLLLLLPLLLDLFFPGSAFKQNEKKKVVNSQLKVVQLSFIYTTHLP